MSLPMVLARGLMFPRAEPPVLSSCDMHLIMATSSRSAQARPDEVRRWADRAACVLIVVASVTIVFLGRTLTFWQDEWRWIAADNMLPLDYFAPHNEHWTTVPALLYRGLFSVVGLHSYVPYLTVLVMVHALAVAGVYSLARRRLAAIPALVLVLPLLLLGAGYENLYWAFQIGFVGSVAAGTWGLSLLESNDRRGGPTGAALLLVGLACSGIGLFFLGAAVVRLLLDPVLRIRATWLSVPATLYLAWYLTFGRGGLERAELADPVASLAFAGEAIAFAFARFSGLDELGSTPINGLVIGVLLGTVAWATIRGRLPPLAIAGLAGIAAMYLAIGLVRAEVDPGFAYRSRYVYVAAFLLVVAVADLLGALRVTWRPPSLMALALVTSLLVATNFDKLVRDQADYQFRADLTREYLRLIPDHQIDVEALPAWWPPTERLLELLAVHGTPLRDDLFPGVEAPRIPEAAARARQAIVATDDP